MSERAHPLQNRPILCGLEDIKEVTDGILLCSDKNIIHTFTQRINIAQTVTYI